MDLYSSDDEVVWETVYERPQVQYRPPHIDGDVPDCQFCENPTGETVKYKILNSKTGYVACNKAECKRTAGHLAGTINEKIEQAVDVFLTYHHIGGNQVMVHGEFYKLQTGSATAIYDIIANDYSIQVMTDNPVGQRRILFLTPDGGVVISRNSIY